MNTKTADTGAITSPASVTKDRKITVGAAPEAAEGKPEGDGVALDAQIVLVRALASFHKEGNFSGELAQPNDEFPCDRLRAAQLRANGLIEFVSADEEQSIFGEDGVKRNAEKVMQREQMSQIAARHRTTPLNNPDIGRKQAKGAKEATTREQLDAALGDLPGDYDDPDYVVKGMRSHFGDLFSDADETRVRELVVKKPTKGGK